MAIISRIFLPFLLLAYIAIETYLKLQHSSLCEATGCKLAGELLKFDSLYLNYFGMAGVTLLIVLGFISLKKAWAKSLFFTVLYGAIAFEATIIIYQFLVNPEPCLFCMGIFSSLLVIAMISRIQNFLMVLSIVFAIGFALSTLALTKNKSYVIANGTYLVHSPTCPHCKKVKTYFANHDIDYHSISSQNSNARAFLKFVNINSIPVLIKKDRSGIRIINGDQEIIAFYENHGNDSVEKAPTSAESNSNIYGMDSNFLTQGAKSSGCALTVTEETPCETDSNQTE